MAIEVISYQDKVDAIVDAIDANNKILVTGDECSGKSYVLKHIKDTTELLDDWEQLCDYDLSLDDFFHHSSHHRQLYTDIYNPNGFDDLKVINVANFLPDDHDDYDVIVCFKGKYDVQMNEYI
jgi:hypothetical protein